MGIAAPMTGEICPAASPFRPNVTKRVRVSPPCSRLRHVVVTLDIDVEKLRFSDGSLLLKLGGDTRGIEAAELCQVTELDLALDPGLFVVGRTENQMDRKRGRPVAVEGDGIAFRLETAPYSCFIAQKGTV